MAFKRAFVTSVPILCSFLPLGFSFGYFALQMDLPPYLIILMSAVIYAGSVEFLVATMLAGTFAFREIFIAASLVNLRHIFYGLSVQQHYPKRGLSRYYMIHALTDETYSILAARQEIDPNFSFWISVLNHAYWVGGVVLGVVAGRLFAFEIHGIEFCLTALFAVLTVEKAMEVKQWFPFVLALISALIANLFFPSQMLFASMIMVCIFLIVTYKIGEKGKWNFQKHTS